MTLQQLYHKIWMERERVSFLTGEPLEYTYSTWLNMFSHCISKGKFKKFAFKEENICLLQPIEHHLFDNGSDSQREKYKEEMAEKGIVVDWNKLFELEKKLWHQYKELDPSCHVIWRCVERDK